MGLYGPYFGGRAVACHGLDQYINNEVYSAKKVALQDLRVITTDIPQRSKTAWVRKANNRPTGVRVGGGDIPTQGLCTAPGAGLACTSTRICSAANLCPYINYKPTNHI